MKAVGVNTMKVAMQGVTKKTQLMPINQNKFIFIK